MLIIKLRNKLKKVMAVVIPMLIIGTSTSLNGVTTYAAEATATVATTTDNQSLTLVLDSNNEDANGLRYELDSNTKTASVSYGFQSDIKTVVIPDEVVLNNEYYKVTRVSGFQGCSSLTDITIPSTVTDIDAYAFSGCSSLASINLPSTVTSIGIFAFQDCTSLTNITIPANVSKLDIYAFNGCTSLKSITLPNTLSTIGQYAFSGCTGLPNITIPDNSVSTIGQYAFNGCTSLTSITLPNSINRVDANPFSNCSSLTSITIPSNITFLGTTIPSKCSYINYNIVNNPKIQFTSNDGNRRSWN